MSFGTLASCDGSNSQCTWKLLLLHRVEDPEFVNIIAQTQDLLKDGLHIFLGQYVMFNESRKI